MGLKNIINSTLASAVMCAAAPAYSNECMPIFAEKSLESMPEPRVEIPVLEVKYKGYWLTEEEYGRMQGYLSGGQLDDSDVKAYLGFTALMRHRELIDFVARHYEVDSKMMLKVINQESTFQISTSGHFKERGLGHNRESTARMLVSRMTDPDDALYYPFLSKGDYSFRKLSRDYRLNVLLVAAMIKVTDSELDAVLSERGLVREDMACRIKEFGVTTSLRRLRNSRKFKFYKVSHKSRKLVNDYWAEHDADVSDLMYLVYNGGNKAVSEIFNDSIVSEVLLYNFTVYNKKKHLVDRFISLYDGHADGHGAVHPEDLEKIVLPEE